MAEEQLTEKQTSLRLEILDKMSTLVTAGFGLVAALAWNEAIQKLFETLFPPDHRDPNSLVAKFLYAILITILIVVVTTKLGRMTNTLKQSLEKKKR